MEFVKIHDPDKPGDYLVLAKRDFDSSKHRVFEAETPPALSGPGEPDSREAKTKARRKG